MGPHAGASEGLGAAFAEVLAKHHLNLVLIARRTDKLEALANALRDKYPIEIISHSIDLADFEQTKQFVSELTVDIGLLVYNAAYAPIGYFENIPEHDLDQIVNVNIKTPLLLTKLISANMIEKGKISHRGKAIEKLVTFLNKYS